MLRVGLGYDLHRFSCDGGDRPLLIGGVHFEGLRGLAGHSDADVLLHSICDAVLGALGLGDLGTHFPDSDPSLKGISSSDLVKKVALMMAERKYRVVNLDSVVIAQEPKISERVPEMKERIAALLGATPEEINVKGTSPEGMGALGRKDGIAAESIVLLGRI